MRYFNGTDYIYSASEHGGNPYLTDFDLTKDPYSLTIPGIYLIRFTGTKHANWPDVLPTGSGHLSVSGEDVSVLEYRLSNSAGGLYISLSLSGTKTDWFNIPSFKAYKGSAPQTGIPGQLWGEY